MEDGGGFVDGEAAEVAEFDDVGLAGIELGEAGEGGVEEGEVDIGRGGVESRSGLFDDADRDGAAAGFIDEDAAHEEGGDSEEVGAAFPLDGGLVEKAEVRFVDEGGGLERCAGRVAAHVRAGEAVEVVIDEGREGVPGFGLAEAEAGEL